MHVQAGRDAQAAATQAAAARTEVQAANSEAAAQRAVAEAAEARSTQLHDSVKRLTADVEKWRVAAESTRDRLRSSSVAAGAADGDAREAKDALKVRLVCYRRRSRPLTGAGFGLCPHPSDAAPCCQCDSFHAISVTEHSSICVFSTSHLPKLR